MSAGVAGQGSGDDCEECNCAIMVANEINAQGNFVTYTVTISADSQGTDLAFMSAKSTMEVCLFYIFIFNALHAQKSCSALNMSRAHRLSIVHRAWSPKLSCQNTHKTLRSILIPKGTYQYTTPLEMSRWYPLSSYIAASIFSSHVDLGVFEIVLSAFMKF